MTPNKDFLPQYTGYRQLYSFRKATAIYQITYYFVEKYLSKSDRTVDQMLQAARSGKQNIAEGNAAGPTSKETEIKLTNVAKASLQELLVDYEDFLVTRRLNKWEEENPKFIQAKEICKTHNDADFYIPYLEKWDAETIANICIILINQTDFLLFRLIEKMKADFIHSGGIREQMSNARRKQRGY